MPVCCNCWVGGPRGCIDCGNCRLRAEAFLKEAVGESADEITISTKNSGGVRVEASKEVIAEILSMRKHGQIAYGDFTFKANASENNPKLMCIKFIPIDPKEEIPQTQEEKQIQEEFEKLNPKKKKS